MAEGGSRFRATWFVRAGRLARPREKFWPIEAGPKPNVDRGRTLDVQTGRR
jgi:hypothetical protein